MPSEPKNSMIMTTEISQQHKNCTILVTHRMDEPMIRYLRFLKEQITEVMDFYILYDCGTQPLDPADYPDLNFHLFNSNELPNFFYCGDRRLPNPLKALIEFSKQHPYQHYLVMEGDLVLCGDWTNFVRKINGLKCDYVHIASDVMGDMRRHYPIKGIKDNPFKHLYFAWCHVFCVSHQYLMDLEEFMKKNDSFYYEMLLPSMAYNRGYYIRQFENLGYQFDISYGPAEEYERRYMEDRRHKTFYHPVKNSSLIEY